jgi:hypothetical protein
LDLNLILKSTQVILGQLAWPTVEPWLSKGVTHTTTKELAR